jgi:hypothetical protein
VSLGLALISEEPTLSQGDKDRARYVAIGEADNFVLKFRKPLR